MEYVTTYRGYDIYQRGKDLFISHYGVLLNKTFAKLCKCYNYIDKQFAKDWRYV